MIYLVITKDDFDKKFYHVSDFVSKLYNYIAKSNNIIAVSNNSLNFNILKLYENYDVTKNFIDFNSSNVILNGLQIAFDNTLEFILKINKFLKDEFEIENSKKSNEDFEILKQFSTVHYINSEFQSAEEAVKDFESRKNEENCVIVDIFGNIENTFDKGNVHIINMKLPKENDSNKKEKAFETTSNSINVGLDGEPAAASAANEPIDIIWDTNSDNSHWDFESVFNKNAIKHSNTNENT